MARRTVRVEIPVSKPDEFSKLLKNIVERHKQLGDKSPLKNFPKVDMGKYDNKRKDADTDRSESEKLREASEAKMQQARQKYGTDKGQTSNTPETLYNNTVLIKEFLLALNPGTEENLSEWGFNVVVGTAKSPSRNNGDDEPSNE